MDEDFETRLKQASDEVNVELAARFDELRDAPPRLLDAMRYSVLAGGKRLRPVLTLWCCELCGAPRRAAMPAAVSVELAHTFSLIHDDLPALDNDDLRRGRPTNHKMFGEATAILAGDALLNLAYEILSKADYEPLTAIALIRELADAVGCRGLIAGEQLDLEGEREDPAESRVRDIHKLKTARLIAAACRMGAIAAKADEPKITTLGEYGLRLGLAFQAVDDILDETGNGGRLGKSVGKDRPAGKQTYVRSVGIQEARQKARQAAAQALDTLRGFSPPPTRLEQMTRFVMERDN
jgi:geranylgeranyl diphosphate synthase type II